MAHFYTLLVHQLCCVFFLLLFLLLFLHQKPLEKWWFSLFRLRKKAQNIALENTTAEREPKKTLAFWRTENGYFWFMGQCRALWAVTSSEDVSYVLLGLDVIGSGYEGKQDANYYHLPPGAWWGEGRKAPQNIPVGTRHGDSIQLAEKYKVAFLLILCAGEENRSVWRKWKTEKRRSSKRHRDWACRKVRRSWICLFGKRSSSHPPLTAKFYFPIFF